MKSDIPTSWEKVSFDEVITQISTIGKKVKTSDIESNGKYPVIDQGRQFISGYLNDEELCIRADDALIIFGDHTREIKWVNFAFIPGADGVKILKANLGLNTRYIYYFLRNVPIENKGYARHFKQLREVEYFIPPLAEQTRIAQKLDELLAQVDTLKARIDGIPALLKRFRQSVLAAAVSGRLTEEWRKQNFFGKALQLNPKAKQLSEDEISSAEEILGGPLPSFWNKFALEQLVDPNRGIPYGIVQTGIPADQGVPTVRCGDVKELYIDTKNLKIVSPEIEADYKRTRLKGGEVLLAIRGSVGNVGVASNLLKGCNISREVAMIPTLDLLSPFYLACLLQSPLGQVLLIGKVRGVAQKGINLVCCSRNKFLHVCTTLQVPFLPWRVSGERSGHYA